MRTKNLAIILSLGTMMLAGCSSMKSSQQSDVAKSGPSSATTTNQAKPGVNMETLNQFTSGWPESSRSAAAKMIEKYGAPSESTANMLTWRNIAPFKRINVYREEVSHKFPILHKDVIEHVVEYKVPVDRAGELTRFNGSVVFDRTRGELSARSDQEAMNILALNLSADILSGKKNASQARSEYGRLAVDLMNGNRTTYTEGLQFGGQYNTADADQSIKINWVQAEETRPASTPAPAAKNAPKASNQEQILKQAQEEEIAE